MSELPPDDETQLDDSLVEHAAGFLAAAGSVCVFTGAGVSAESGIATFRDDGGFWARYPVEQFATPSGLARTAIAEPGRLAAFLLDVLRPVARANPNNGHRAIAELEAMTEETVVVTQNIDGLHQRAGSGTVHEIHGSLFDIQDLRGRPVRRLERQDLLDVVRALEQAEQSPGPLKLARLAQALRPVLGLDAPTRAEGMRLAHRPSIVLFGEGLAEPAWTDAQHAVERCDVMLMVGTSGEVYPANLLPRQVRGRGRPVIGVGPEEVDADLWLTGRAASVLPLLLQRARAHRGRV